MSKNLFETYKVNRRTYTDNLGINAMISIPKKQYIEYEQQNEEIERLNKERENDIKYNKYLQKELAKSNNIIKEVRERLIKPSKYIERVERLKLLEILNKEK